MLRSCISSPLCKANIKELRASTLDLLISETIVKLELIGQAMDRKIHANDYRLPKSRSKMVRYIGVSALFASVLAA